MGQKSYLVTGGAGMVGSHLVLHLVKNGYEVGIFDHAPRKSPFYMDERVKIIDADTRIPGAVSQVIEDYDAVVHLAGNVDVRESIKNPIEDADNNIMGAINVLEACRKHNKTAIIHPVQAFTGIEHHSPLREDGDTVPVSPYGQSKLCAEHYFRLYNSLYNVKSVSLRILNIAGPLKFKGVFYNFANALVNDEPITIYGNGEQSRDFICVGDVVDAIMKSVQTKKWGEVYNIGTGEPTTVNQLLKIFKSFSDDTNHVRYKDKVKGEIKTSYADIKKARDILGWRPRGNLKEEIDRIMVWAKGGADVKSWRDMHGI